MRRIILLLSLLLVTCLLADTVSAQNRKAGLNSAAFLKIGVGARHVGLGSAATSLTGDVTNMFWNPAGVALNGEEKIQASFTYNRWFASLTQNALAASYKLEDIGTIGIGVMTFGKSNIQADRDIYPDNPALVPLQIDQATSSTYDYMDLLAMLSYSRYLTDKLSLGVNIKYISSKIDDQTTSTVAFDLGSVYHIGVLGWNIAARINNLGGDIKFYDYGAPLPLTFGVGTSFRPFEGKNKDFDLLLAIDMVKPQDGTQYYFLGAEYTFVDLLSLRTGYKFNYSGESDGGTSFQQSIPTTVEGISIGGGFKAQLEDYAVRLDYAYTNMDLLGGVHRITLFVGMK